MRQGGGADLNYDFGEIEKRFKEIWSRAVTKALSMIPGAIEAADFPPAFEQEGSGAVVTTSLRAKGQDLEIVFQIKNDGAISRWHSTDAWGAGDLGNPAVIQNVANVIVNAIRKLPDPQK
jgi:hypothetical protein